MQIWLNYFVENGEYGNLLNKNAIIFGFANCMPKKIRFANLLIDFFRTTTLS